MSWQDPQGPWAKAMRRRVYWGVAGCAPFFLLVGFQALMYCRGVWGGQALPYWAALAALFLLAELWGLRVQRSIRKLVPLHEGLVCPRCRVALQELPRDVLCPRCKRRYAADKVRAFWEQYAFSPLAAQDWFRKQLAGPASGWGPRCLKFLAVVFMALMLLGGIYFIGRIGGGTFLGNLAVFFPLVLMIPVPAVIAVLVVRGYRQRAGQERFCATCGYQQAPDAESPPQCPECGAAWTRPGGSLLGGRDRRGRKMLIGIVALGLVMALLPLLTFRWNLLRLLPTGALIDQIVATEGLDSKEWAILQTRTPSSAQELRLAEGLLDKRLQGKFLSQDAETWFVAGLGSGRLPKPIVERYYREMLKLWIDAPASAKVGERFRVSAGSQQHENMFSFLTGSGTGFAYVAGFLAGDDSPPLGRSEQAIALTLLDHTEFTPAADIVAQRPGPLRIRLIVWLVVAPPGTNLSGRIQWQNDGTPIIPPGVEWAERIEAEAVVQIHE